MERPGHLSHSRSPDVSQPGQTADTTRPSTAASSRLFGPGGLHVEAVIAVHERRAGGPEQPAVFRPGGSAASTRQQRQRIRRGRRGIDRTLRACVRRQPGAVRRPSGHTPRVDEARAGGSDRVALAPWSPTAPFRTAPFLSCVSRSPSRQRWHPAAAPTSLRPALKRLPTPRLRHRLRRLHRPRRRASSPGAGRST